MKKLAVFVALTLMTGMLAAAFAEGGECGTGLTWDLNLDTGVLTVSGTGAMADFEDGAPWDTRKDMITKVVIGSGVTSVGKCAFNSCGSLSEAELPAGLRSIGDGAFSYCGGLAESACRMVCNPSGIWRFLPPGLQASSSRTR